MSNIENKPITPAYSYRDADIERFTKKTKKFKIEDPLTEQLIKSLTTKIVYTLSHFGVLTEYKGTVDCEVFSVTPYTSMVGDTRFVLEFVGAFPEPLIVMWNGKFSIRRKSAHSGLFVNVKDLNVQNDLDKFVEYEQKVVGILQTIEKSFFEAVPVNVFKPGQEEEENI